MTRPHLHRCHRCGRTWTGPSEGIINQSDYCHPAWSSGATCYMLAAWDDPESAAKTQAARSLSEILEDLLR